MRRFPWYLVVGLVVGIVTGIVISLLIAPVRYVDTAPSSLNASAKDDYRSLIALAYLADGDLGRATSRLGLLRDLNVIEALSAQSQKVYTLGGASDEAQGLSLLAVSLYQLASGTLVPTVAPTINPLVTPAAPTLTPLATFTPRPAATFTPTIGAPYVVLDRKQVCDPALPPGLLEVVVIDAAGNPKPGVTLTVTWQGGQDHFVTGLFPETSPGYADFQMNTDVIYTLQAGEDGEQTSNLQAPQCTNTNGSTYWGGWQITYKQP